MSNSGAKYLRFGVAIAVIVLSLGYLAYTGVEQSKSYYVTIAELRQEAAQGDAIYSKRLRVAGTVEPGSIRRQGSKVEFTLVEQGNKLAVVYRGTEAPPDTFKDESQALAEGEFGRDGVFHAKQLQAKCASKYAPAPGQPGAPGAPAVQQTPPSTVAPPK
jgi:cytochrome c-type biogenesis protein CcmE